MLFQKKKKKGSWIKNCKKVWAKYSYNILFFDFSQKMFNISDRNERTWMHIRSYIPRPCPDSHTCKQGHLEWKLPTTAIWFREHHTRNETEKVLAFIYWLHCSASGCIDIYWKTRLLDRIQGYNKANSRAFGAFWGEYWGFFPFL